VSISKSAKRRLARENEITEQALGVADVSVIATPVFLACGFAMKKMLMQPGSIDLEKARPWVSPFPDAEADEVVSQMITDAVRIFGVVAEYGLQNTDEIEAFLNDELAEKN